MSEDLTEKLKPNKTEFSTVMDAVKDLTGNLEAFYEKVELRLYDTRPMWEQVSVAVLQLHEGQLRIEQGQVVLQESYQRLEENYKRLEHGQAQLQETYQRLEAGHLALDRESREIKTLQRDTLRRLSIFNDTLVTMQADYRDIYDRVRGLEKSKCHSDL
jgi:uncharacterized protein (DUF3084 family)